MIEKKERYKGKNMDNEDKLRVLAKIGGLLNQNGIVWAVGGSLLLYFEGITESFNDIDILIDENDISRAKKVLDEVGELKAHSEDKQYRTKIFLEYTIEDVEIDVIAGLVIMQMGREYYFPLKKKHITRYISVQGTEIPLHSLKEWARYYQLMGRRERAECLIAYLDKNEIL